MHGLLEICQALEQTPVAAGVRESTWLFPIVECIHLLGMVAFLAAIGTFDLRLLGAILRGASVEQVARRIFPLVWAGFSLQVVTGFLLFSSEATKMARNPAFRFKLLFIAVAGLNALIFRLGSYRGKWAGDADACPPPAAKIAALVSLLVWPAVVVAGRLIGFM